MGPFTQLDPIYSQKLRRGENHMPNWKGQETEQRILEQNTQLVLGTANSSSLISSTVLDGPAK